MAIDVSGHACDTFTTKSYYSKLPCEKRNTVPKQESYFYILESESSQGSDDGTESVMSVQGRETDLAKDTSDTDWSIEDSDVEYELVSSSEERVEDLQSQVIDGDITSDSDDAIISTTFISITMLNEGDIVSADSEESVNGTASESEKYLLKYSKCAQCGNANNNLKFRYCEKCFKLRKEFFPPRPKPKRTKSIKNKQQERISRFKSNVKHMKSILISPIKNGLADDISSGGIVNLAPKLNFQDIVVPASINDESSSYDSMTDYGMDSDNKIKKNCMNRKRKTKASDGLDVKKVCKDERVAPKDGVLTSDSCEPLKSTALSSVDDNISFSQPVFSAADSIVSPLSKSFSDQGPMSVKDDHDLRSHPFSDNDNRVAINGEKSSPKKIKNNKFGIESEMCIMCLTEPKSGVFVHGRIAHICCCYKCSVEIWRKNKRCPICNCKVNNVLRAFVV